MISQLRLKKYSNAWAIIKLFELKIIRFKNRCQECNVKGSKKRPLHWAHTKDTLLNGRGRGSYKRYKDVLKNPKSYTLLCSACHLDYDN